MSTEPIVSLAPDEDTASDGKVGGTDFMRGLTANEAENLLKEHGSNALPENPPPSNLEIFVSQLKNPLIYVLLGAGTVTFLLREIADTIIIGLAVVINTILGYIQESRAGQALEALKKLVHPHTQVVRDGKIQTIAVETVVPGDIVLLGQGDKIPADGILVEANRFFVTEAILTGESDAIEKKKDAEIYMGTIVTAGKAKMLVKVTGEKTEMGKIALSIAPSEEVTPLGKQLTKFSKQLSILVLGLVTLVFILGILFADKSHDLADVLVEIFTTAVALAVSAIPEGLLVGLTVVLAIGMQRILARKGLVRNLVSAETLGGVTTICVDKTGTLTEGRMRVVNVIGEEYDIARQIMLSNDLDTSVAVAAWEWGNEVAERSDIKRAEKEAVLDSIPFSSEYKFYASLNKVDEGCTIFVTGAPEVLLENTTLSESEKQELREKIDQLSGQGRRLLGFAQKAGSADCERLEKDEILKDLIWTGMLAFVDPVRPDVKEALAKTREAGINLIVITGDYANTAVSVLSELGIEIKPEEIMLGAELENTNGKELENKLFSEEGERIKLFARTKPAQKLKIVETLKQHGEVVAMMGDGVNDAPALSKSDIGIVVGEATDVAKESADLVLLDSSFSTIIAAIEEGRGIFDNIRKIILYLMSDAFEEILIVITALIVQLPAPITAVQILWINLVSDGFPNLALTVDPRVEGIMKKPPRSPKEALIAKWMRNLIAIVSLTGGVFAFAMFYFSYHSTQDLVFARSVTFATVGINSLVYVFSVRTLQEPFWKEKLFDNKWLVAAVVAGFGFQIFPYLTPEIREFFSIEPLGWYWAGAFGASILMFFTIEISKWLFKHKLRASHHTHHVFGR